MNLKDLRELANLTRESVAKKLNVDQSCVAHWELGDWAPPRKHWRKLSKLYGAPIELIETIAAEIKRKNKGKWKQGK